jgi:hypothetical protein
MNVTPAPIVPGPAQNQIGDDATQQPAPMAVNQFGSPPNGFAGSNGFNIDHARGADGGGRVPPASSRTSNPWQGQRVTP